MNSVGKYRLDKGTCSSEVGHYVAMAQKANYYMCFVCTIQKYSKVGLQTLVGLVENKIDNKTKLIITE